MRRFSLLLAALSATCLPAQVRRSSLPQTAEAALVAYEKVADQPEANRRLSLSRLGRFDTPEITQILLRELAAAQTPLFKRTVVGAMGMARHTGVLPALLAIFDDEAAGYSLRYAATNALGRQGEAGVTALIQRLEATRGTSAQNRGLRSAMLRALGTAGTPRALESTLR